MFRCRLYSFHAPADSKTGAIAEMRLHRFVPGFETLMRQHGYDLKLIPRSSATDVDAIVEHLDGCGITWGPGEEGTFVGLMKHGSCVVTSQRDAGVRLRIEDDLRLGEMWLDVNDRGYDCETGRLVYGNHRGVPYRLLRRA